MKGRRVFLIGPPAAGKSTIGKRWAQRLGVPFWDTDIEIERRTGRTIPEWFAKGETAFRIAERRVIEELLAEEGIIAVGGGFPAQPGAMPLLRSMGWVIWIDPPLSWLLHRWEKAALHRPLLQSLSLSERLALLEKRRPFYKEAELHWRPDYIPESFIQRWVAVQLRV